MAKKHDLYTTKQGYVGTLKVVNGKIFRRGGIDANTEQLHFARIPQHMRHLNYRQLYNALEEHYGETCYCEHDCCGHFFGGVQDIHINGRYLMFRTHYQRNL